MESPDDVVEALPLDDVDWPAWVKAWDGVVVLAFINGALHRIYGPALGELTAHQLSCLVLLLLVAPWANRTERHHPLSTPRAAVAVGAVWAASTVTFEFLVGHYLNGDSWSRLLSDYDLRRGRLWSLVVIGIALAPALARLQRRRTTGSPCPCGAQLL